MHVLLIYNPHAGDGVHAQLRELVDMVHAAGHEVRCRSSKDPHVRASLAEPADLVAVAGGDGTVVKVVRLLRGRKTPIAPLPLGTANNICAALGLQSTDLESLIQGWDDARTIAMDVGIARTPRGSRTFLESVGLGLFARLMSMNTSDEPARGGAQDRLARAVARVTRAARRAPAVQIQALLDGHDISGRYVLLEAMNTGWVGPNLNVADADAADGAFDLVLVTEAEREMLVEWLAAKERGEPLRYAFPAVRGRTLRIVEGDFGVHVDDEVWSLQRNREEVDASLEVAMRDTVCFRVPRSPPAVKTWMHRACIRDADLADERRNRRFELTPSRWAWPAGRRARSHR